MSSQDTVRYLPTSNPARFAPPIPLDGGGGGGNDGEMEVRIAKLESQMEKANDRLQAIDLKIGKIETKIDENFKHFATKSDVSSLAAEMSKGFNALTWRLIGIVVVAQILPAIPKLVEFFNR